MERLTDGCDEVAVREAGSDEGAADVGCCAKDLEGESKHISDIIGTSTLCLHARASEREGERECVCFFELI